MYPRWQLETSKNPWWNRPLKLGEVACGISHVLAWERIASRGQTTLILEDDAILVEGYTQALREIAGERSSCSTWGGTTWSETTE